MWLGLSAFISSLGLIKGGGWIKPMLFMAAVVVLAGLVFFCQWQKIMIVELEQKRTELEIALAQADVLIMNSEAQLQEQIDDNQQAMALLDTRYQAQLAISAKTAEKQAQVQQVFYTDPVAKAWADELVPVDVIRLLEPSAKHQISD